MTIPLEPAAVIREHARFVWRVLRHLGVAEQRLDDLTQEVFLVVLARLPSFEGRSSLRTWIYGICRHVGQRARQRSNKQRELLVSELPELSDPATQDRTVWLKQAHAQLVAALDTLDADQRSVFLLYEIEELPMEEIATALEVPLTTCYSRLAVAREKLAALQRKAQQKGEFKLLRGGAR
jgi:RNA polymerase sigma-70 factor (ECF subfamily)